LSKSCVKHVFPKHPLSHNSVIQVFHEDHVTSVAKGVSLFVMKVLPGVVNLVVESSNFDALFFVVFRPTSLPGKSALQRLSREDARPLR
jgi:hypothetical protein